MKVEMSVVEGWEIKQLSEVIKDIGDGGTPNTNKKEYFNGSVPWVVIQDIRKDISATRTTLTPLGLKSCSAKLWPAGSIILSTGATIGEVGMAEIPVATKQGIHGIVCNKELSSHYLYYKLQTLRDFLNANAQGSTIREVRATFLRTIPILFPTSKPEQTKIAEILSTVDRAIEQTEALIAKQQRIKTGLMQDLLTRGIDEHGNLRSEETHEFKDSPLGRIPVEWDVRTLRDVACEGAQNGFFKKPELVGSGYKLINVSEIYQPFSIDTNREEVERVKATPNDLLKYGVNEGDLFFTRSSLVLEGIAHCNLIRTINEPTLFECHVIRIKPDKDIISPEFLTLFCQSNVARLFLMSRAKHVTMTTISQPELEALKVPVPPTLEEQMAIVDSVLSSERTIRHAENQKNKLHLLKTALMQDLLTGKKRVTDLLSEMAVKSG